MHSRRTASVLIWVSRRLPSCGLQLHVYLLPMSCTSWAEFSDADAEIRATVAATSADEDSSRRRVLPACAATRKPLSKTTQLSWKSLRKGEVV